MFLIPEAKGVDLGSDDIVQYFQCSVRGPKGHKDADMKKLTSLLTDIINDTVEESAASEDLVAVKAGVLELWGWRRRGGGVADPDIPTHLLALEDLQDVDLDTGREIDRDLSKVDSPLLNKINMDEADKKEIGKVMASFSMGAVQSILWNSIVLMVAFLLLINFLLLKGSG